MTPTQVMKGASGRHSSSRFSHMPLAVLIVTANGLVMACAGCIAPLTPARLPLKAVATPAAIGASAAKTALPAMTPRQQVLAALAGYMTALGQAEESRSSEVARELLRPYLAADRVEGLVRAMTAIWARGESFHGQDLRHVSKVTVVGRHAFVHDCDDTSGTALVDIVTGELVPGSSGTSRANVVTRLELAGSHWLVQFQLVEDVPCTP
jgi:hypothetical protein